MADKNKKKPVRTITGGYVPDKRSQGQKHGEAAKKKKTQKKWQDRHIKLLTNDGKGTPRPKAKTAGVGSLASKPKVQGPKNNPIKADSSGVKNLGVKKPKVKKVGEIKAKKGMDLKAKASTDGPKKPELKFKQTRKAKRQMANAKKLSAKADAGAKSGSITRKKYDRLNKRAQRKAERSTGKRKSVVGTALKAVGKGAQAFGHAYAYGNTSRLKGDKVSSKKKK